MGPLPCVLLNHLWPCFFPAHHLCPALYRWSGNLKTFFLASWCNVKLCWEKGAFWVSLTIPWLPGQFSQQQWCFLERLSRTPGAQLRSLPGVSEPPAGLACRKPPVGPLADSSAVQGSWPRSCWYGLTFSLGERPLPNFFLLWTLS